MRWHIDQREPDEIATPPRSGAVVCGTQQNTEAQYCVMNSEGDRTRRKQEQSILHVLAKVERHQAVERRDDVERRGFC